MVVAAPQANRSNELGHRSIGTRVTALSVLPLLHMATVYKHKGKHLVSVAAWKKHLALYGLNVDIAREFQTGATTFDISGKTIQFTADKLLSSELVRKLLQARVDEIDAEAKKT
jgi:uncharacterized protein YdhG (YjbR/CyaY superfamily)